MGKSYFPLFTDISGKRILVVGGGSIATRRVNTLLPFEPFITVTAKKLTPRLELLKKEGKITCHQRGYIPEDLTDADMVLAATDDHELNRAIVKACKMLEKERDRPILVNAADDKNLCDFYFPSVIHKDDLVIAVSSGGEAPGRVKELRKKLEGLY